MSKLSSCLGTVVGLSCHGMKSTELLAWVRPGALLAIQLLFVVVWGFSGLDKVIHGKPDWFADKFGGTWLAMFPGLSLTFWTLAVSEVLALALAGVALMRLEFLPGRRPVWLSLMLMWSLFVFLQLCLGQWITREFAGAQQIFLYFVGTLVMLHFVRVGERES